MYFEYRVTMYIELGKLIFEFDLLSMFKNLNSNKSESGSGKIIFLRKYFVLSSTIPHFSTLREGMKRFLEMAGHYQFVHLY